VCHAVRAPGSKVTLAPTWIVCLEQGVNAHGAGEILSRPFSGRLWTASFDVHFQSPLFGFECYLYYLLQWWLMNRLTSSHMIDYLSHCWPLLADAQEVRPELDCSSKANN
jgi:hypothetical protein